MRSIIVRLLLALVAFGGLLTATATPAQAATPIAPAVSMTYFVPGDSLGLSTDGPWYNQCHHYVHFTYPTWMDGRIESYTVQEVGTFGTGPSLWGAPSTGQANAGYHNWGQPDCAADTQHSPGQFWMWLTVRQ